MKIPGVKTAKAASRWVRARILGGALILGYHRISRPEADPYDNCVSPEHFAEHLDALRRWTNPLRLSQLVNHLKSGSLPPRSVAVTFDDGYVDNLEHAKPLLETYDIPATVFVSTGYKGREFWWDELDRLVMFSSADPGSLRLETGAGRFQQKPHSRGKEAEYPRQDTDRRQFARELYTFLLALDVEDLQRAMDTIRIWSALPSARDAVRAMDPNELKRLADSGLIELGSHTCNHLFLPRLSLERQREEILAGKQELETVLGKPVAGFAYPNGQFTEETRQIVREAGFAYACTSLQDVVRPETDLYDLTRFWQRDVDGDKFISGLNLWLKTR
jgi:peptidoglycan/xylan/chitin deacetylase (PgdA/CDA1 family)